MAQALQARATPTANTVTALFTVPAGRTLPPGAQVLVVNRDTADHVVSFKYAPGGEADSANQLMSPPSGIPVPAGTSIVWMTPIMMSAGDVCRVVTDGNPVDFTINTIAR